MKLQVIGIEISEGVSKKSGRGYAIGTLHTMTELAPPLGGDSNVAKGWAGDKYDVPVELLRKVQHLPLPFNAEVEVKAVMRFNERHDIVTDLRPLDVVRAKAA